MEDRKAFSRGSLTDLIRSEGLYRFLLSLLYWAILYIFLGQYLRLPDFHGYHVLTGIAVLLSLGLLSSAKGRIKIMVAAFILAGIILFGSIVEWKNCLEVFKAWPKWAFFGELEEKTHLAGCECIQAALIAAGAFLLSQIVYRHPIPKAVISALCLVGLFVLMAAGVRVPHLGSVIVITILLMSIAELLRSRWKKQKTGSSPRFLMYIMPAFLLYGALVFAMPAPEKPYDWELFRKAYSAVEEGVRKFSQSLVLNHGSAYRFSYSGFSEDSSLSGNVRSSDQENLLLKSRTGLRTPLYLSGRVMSHFNGRDWTEDDEASEMDYAADAFQTYLAVSRADPSYQSDYLNNLEMTVSYRYIRTNAVFVPQKTSILRSEDEEKIFEDESGNLRFNRRKGYGTEYTVKFSLMNLGTSYFRELLSTPQDPYDPDFIHTFYRRFSAAEPELTAQDIQAYRGHMHQRFRETPEISEELSAYLSEAYEGTKKKSLDRLLRLEQLLSSYTYDTSPGKLPSDVKDASDFLDYFMLEKRAGYCTHFATAFVLLARAEGYPARYVQGFLVPSSNSTEITVMSSMSHAWPEVYFDNIGWIPFEPTPGFGSMRYSGWKTIAREGEEKNGSSGDGAPQPGQEDFMPDPEEFDPGLITPPEEEEEGFDYEMLRRVLRAILLAVGFLIAFFILFIVTERLIRKIRYLRKNDEGKYLMQAQQLLQMLSFLGTKRREDETVRELRVRASSELQIPEDDMAFLSDYEALLYGGSFHKKRALSLLQTGNRRISSLMLKKKRVRYLLFRLIYG